MNHKLLRFLLPWLMLLFAQSVTAQPQSIIVNLAPIDGIELTPDNIFNYQVQVGGSAGINATIKGTVRYKASGLSFSYSMPYTLRPGMNMIGSGNVHPQWTYSSSGLRELFTDYKKLPEGTYEYCVTVTPMAGGTGEAIPGANVEECLYQKVNDIFLINLIEPEDNAKIYEYYPNLSWIVNYPFASALTYRIRVAKIEQGQNKENAVVRNNPVYSESNIMATAQTYPVYAKPLELNQPYAWTVDAYYKGILLGGAAPWKFTIIEDSALKMVPRIQSYYEFEKHNGDTRLYATGELKLKYMSERQNDTLYLQLLASDNKEIKLDSAKIPLQLGDNRMVIPFADKIDLGHLSKYTLNITTGNQKKFAVPFTYVNPLFLR